MAQQASPGQGRQELALPWRTMGIRGNDEQPGADKTSIFSAEHIDMENVAPHAGESFADHGEAARAVGEAKVTLSGRAVKRASRLQGRGAMKVSSASGLGRNN